MSDDIMMGHVGTFGTCTYPDFKEHVASFLRMEPDSTLAQVENGVKAVGIYYMAMTGSELEKYEASILWEMVTRKLLDRTVEAALEENNSKDSE